MKNMRWKKNNNNPNKRRRAKSIAEIEYNGAYKNIAFLNFQEKV